MATYTKDNRPTRLRDNDIVIIKNLHYKVDAFSPGRLRPPENSPWPEVNEISQILNMQQAEYIAFVTKAFGYESTDYYYWPTAKPNDWEAHCRLVNAIYDVLDQQESQPSQKNTNSGVTAISGWGWGPVELVENIKNLDLCALYNTEEEAIESAKKNCDSSFYICHVQVNIVKKYEKIDFVEVPVDISTEQTPAAGRMLRKLSKEQIVEDQRLHDMWCRNEPGGKRIDWSGADLTGADLIRANLIKANLVGANLNNANLYGANLTDANLTRADLTGANLNRANLNRANLTEARLVKANLDGANLNNANLYGANLTKANLHGADLTNASLTDAYLVGANLDSANLYGADLTDAGLTNTSRGPHA